MRIGTLFSGIGAPEQGARRVYGNDLELVFACEYDKFARQSFNANYEIAAEHFHNDVREMDGTQYQGKVDVLIGGSPCQAFSIAGLRNGTDDERGQLIYQYIRIVDEVKAPVIVYENVKGMLSIGGGSTIREFVQALRDIGYYCHYEVVNTKHYGVPQNRERIFLVGFLGHEMYHRFKFAPKQKLEKRLKDVLQDEVDEKYYLSDATVAQFIKKTERAKREGNGFAFKPTDGGGCAFSITTKAGGRVDDNFINEGVIGLLDCKGTDQIRRVYGTDGSAPCLQTMQGGNREPKIQVKSATSCGYELAEDGDSINLSVPNSTTRRGRAGKQVAQTLDTQCNQAVYEPKILDERIEITGSQQANAGMMYDCCTSLTSAMGMGGGQIPIVNRIRKLTPLECWRLQDFPDSAYNKARDVGVSNSQLYKQAGNSMSVNVLEMIFRQIEKAKDVEDGRLF